MLTRLAVEQTHRTGVVDTKLSFEAPLWRFLTRQLNHQRMDLENDFRNIGGLYAMLIA